MITIKSQVEQDTISKYFSEWSRGGVTRFWIGISDVISGRQCDLADTEGRRIDFSNFIATG
jgi:hypothetical protein